jgi:hypothetical protein
LGGLGLDNPSTTMDWGWECLRVEAEQYMHDEAPEWFKDFWLSTVWPVQGQEDGQKNGQKNDQKMIRRMTKKMTKKIMTSKGSAHWTTAETQVMLQIFSDNWKCFPQNSFSRFSYSPICQR